ncbi:helix-turn-helix domain-containing protein [Acetobacter sicerae]|uniref:Helix-turn-helix domain-containing protein n=2 Tax=Acetobacter TaxID=434 RepID=A0ABS8VU08_9PROT|nr:helix-turn-helix domain-containing protein [Acetobacter sicerae]MCE0744473.1 helix-turn-helix domain-containing protein [Acetobacter sicerae]
MTTAIQTAILNTFRAGQISRTAKDVLLIIARSIRPASYESLARAAKCSRRSVAYAIQQAEQLGILCRSHHRIRRGRRWMNGCNGYRFIMKALTEMLAFPWSRSQCKPCTTGNEDKKNTRWMPHSPEEYRLICARMDAGMTPREAGYRGSLA